MYIDFFHDCTIRVSFVRVACSAIFLFYCFYYSEFFNGIAKRFCKYDGIAAVAFAYKVVQAFVGVVAEVANDGQPASIVYNLLQDFAGQATAKIEERLGQRFLVEDDGVGGQVHHGFEKILGGFDHRTVSGDFRDELAMDDVQYVVHLSKSK